MHRLWIGLLMIVSAAAQSQLPAESIPNVLTLQEDHPDTWVYAHDPNFFSLVDGKVVVLDVAADTRNYKGHIGAGQFASFVQSTVRPELYVSETFYSRRTYGKRTDVLTIYDTVNLAPVGEIILPGEKRAHVVTQKAVLRLTDNDRLALVSNFTPASSVTVVDLENRVVLGEVETPGCNMLYPTGKRGFSSLCVDGRMITIALNEDGTVAETSTQGPIMNVDEDPLFIKTAAIGGIRYFPSFKGQIQPIDFSGAKPKVLKKWSMVPNYGAENGWRPGGWQIISGHPDGRIFVLMNPEGSDGSHKDGGSNVWVFNAKTGERVQDLELKTWGVSLEVTHSKPAYLVVTNANMQMDVYAAQSGELIRTIGDRAAEMPLMIHASQ